MKKTKTERPMKQTKYGAWFEVDRDGLRDLVAGRDFGFVANELLQNAFDEDGVTRVTINVGEIDAGEMYVEVRDDSPAGFSRLDHAWTLFASSKKKSNPEKRGRFNLGEKLVFAIAERGTITTTTGSVEFHADGRTFNPVRRADKGSTVSVVLRATRSQRNEILAAVRRIIVPENIELRLVDGSIEDFETRTTVVAKRVPIERFEKTLPTVLSDGSGVLRSSRRHTEVRVYSTIDGRAGWIYELGIPVAETGDKYDYDVRQRIPLGTERDTVSPAFLREVRAGALDAVRHYLSVEDAIEDWVSDAIESPNVSTSAVNAVMHKRFGEKRVSFDPSDREANSIATSKGFTVVHGGSLSAEAWKNVRRAEDLVPAGRVTPSPRPYSPDGSPLRDYQNVTPGMRTVEAFAKSLAEIVLVRSIGVRFVSEPTWPFAATYGPSGLLTFNVGRLGKDWFELGYPVEILDLLIHEFGHEYESNHLSEKYHEALTKIGAKVAIAVARKSISLSPIGVA